MDTLILGCTHYPLLREVIGRVVGDRVTLVDSAEVTAETVVLALKPAPECSGQGRVVHFVTGDPVAFAHTAAAIGGLGGTTFALPVNAVAPKLSAISGQLEPFVHVGGDTKDRGE